MIYKVLKNICDKPVYRVDQIVCLDEDGYYPIDQINDEIYKFVTVKEAIQMGLIILIL